MLSEKAAAHLANHPFVQYYSKQKLEIISYYVHKGFGVQAWSPTERKKAYLGSGYTHLLGGLQFGTLETYKQVRASGEPYIFLDGGYLLAKRERNNMDTWNIRVVPNAYQQNWISKNQDDSRLEKLFSRGLTISNWQYSKSSNHILLIPPSSPAVADLFGLQNWEFKIIKELKKYTNRQIIIRRKGSDIPLQQHLTSCHAVVSFTSNVAVDGLLQGVPSFCSSWNAARPVSLLLTDLSRIEDPLRVERLSWLRSLANNQFTLEEIFNGYAKEVVMNEMVSRT